MKYVNISCILSCNNRCQYCPQQKRLISLPVFLNRSENKKINIESLIEYFKEYLIPEECWIEITGGEPSLFPRINELLEKLSSLKYRGIIRTNGNMPLLKTDGFKIITTWHMDKPFPSTPYDGITIIDNPKDDWETKIKYCKNKNIPYQKMKFVPVGEKSTPFPGTKMIKSDSFLSINNFGQLSNCTKDKAYEEYTLINKTQPTIFELNKRNIKKECPNCKLILDFEYWMDYKFDGLI